MSAYDGYRIQINGEVFPNNMIAAGSYKVTPSVKRVASEIQDANGKKHIKYYPRTGAEIEFKIRKRSIEKQEEIAHFFASDENYDLVYWDDREMKYKTGDFELEDIEIQHKNTRNNSIVYEETTVKFERL